MNSAGVSCIVGGYASNICLATTQAAARYDLPYVVDVGVADSIVTRGLKNTFRFGPGFGVIAKTALDNLVAINDGAGKPAKTVDDRARRLAVRLRVSPNCSMRSFPRKGFQVLDTIPHPTPTRDFNTIVLKIKAQNPGSRHSGQLLQRVRPARPHHAAAARAAEGDLFGARRRGLVVQVRQGISGCRQRHHGLQSLVQSDERQGAGAEKAGRGQGPVLHLRGLSQLQLCRLDRRRARARGLGGPRQDHSRRSTTRPGPATSCLTGRPSSSTARIRARRPATRRCRTTTSR